MSNEATHSSGSPVGDAIDDLKKTSFSWLLIRGIAAVLLGVLLLIAPGLGAATVGIFIVVCIGVWLIIDGFATSALAFRERKAGAPGWGWTLAGGIAAILAGVLALIFPLSIAAFGGLMILWFMAIGLFVRGALEIGSRRLGGWGIALGILNILFGILFVFVIIMNPAVALVSLVWVAAIYGIVFGIAAIVLAFQVRKAK